MMASPSWRSGAGGKSADEAAPIDGRPTGWARTGATGRARARLRAPASTHLTMGSLNIVCRLFLAIRYRTPDKALSARPTFYQIFPRYQFGTAHFLTQDTETYSVFPTQHNTEKTGRTTE